MPLDLFFHHGDQTQVVRFDGKPLYLLCSLAEPSMPSDLISTGETWLLSMSASCGILVLTTGPVSQSPRPAIAINSSSYNSTVPPKASLWSPITTYQQSKPMADMPQKTLIELTNGSRGTHSSVNSKPDFSQYRVALYSRTRYTTPNEFLLDYLPRKSSLPLPSPTPSQFIYLPTFTPPPGSPPALQTSSLPT